VLGAAGHCINCAKGNREKSDDAGDEDSYVPHSAAACLSTFVNQGFDDPPQNVRRNNESEIGNHSFSLWQAPVAVGSDYHHIVVVGLTPHLFRNQFATEWGSNLTHVPMWNEGMRPAFACLKIVIRETDNRRANSSAVKA
jgi:hypothetical protein